MSAAAQLQHDNVFVPFDFVHADGVPELRRSSQVTYRQAWVPDSAGWTFLHCRRVSRCADELTRHPERETVTWNRPTRNIL